MTRKTIVITGSSDGIGKAAARHLSANGHDVIIHGRSLSKTKAVARELDTVFYLADFTNLDEVYALADMLLEMHPRIDVLVNNAGGIWGRKRRVTPDGHEITFQVNYLASFLLTMLLLDRLIESRAVVIFTSSVVNSDIGHIDINNLENEKNYNPTKAYGDSKLAQILFTRELHRRYGQSGLASAAFHPGNIASNFYRESALRFLYKSPIRNLWLEPPEIGADTLVFLAEGQPGTDFPSGEYFFHRKAAKPNKQADDLALSSELWELSEAAIKPLMEKKSESRKIK